MIPAGITTPNTKAMSKIIDDLGETGAPSARGASMILALSAVAAMVMEFSSRFCSNMRYKPDLISCWREMLVRMRSCSGACSMRTLYLPAWRSMSCLAISNPLRTEAMELITLECCALMEVLRF